MSDFILATTLGLVRLLVMVFIIIIPLMLALELFRHYGLLQKVIKLFRPLTDRLGFAADSVYPLIAGIIFGLSYGGGVLISEARRGRIVGDQAFLLAVFLGLCHAVFEDTLLFASQGAVWWIILSVRFTLAIAVTYVISVILRRVRQ